MLNKDLSVDKITVYPTLNNIIDTLILKFRLYNMC